MTSGSLHGQLDARFEPLRDILEDSLASGAECGLSLAVDIDGQTVADVWGGFADEARTRLWEPAGSGRRRRTPRFQNSRWSMRTGDRPAPLSTTTPASTSTTPTCAPTPGWPGFR